MIRFAFPPLLLLLLLTAARTGQAFRLAGSPLAAPALLWRRRLLQQQGQGPRAAAAAAPPGPAVGRRHPWVVAAFGVSEEEGVAVAWTEGQGGEEEKEGGGGGGGDGVGGRVVDVEDESTVEDALRLEAEGGEQGVSAVASEPSGAEEEDDVRVCLSVCTTACGPRENNERAHAAEPMLTPHPHHINPPNSR